jgi:hypothetical protein
MNAFLRPLTMQLRKLEREGACIRDDTREFCARITVLSFAMDLRAKEAVQSFSGPCGRHGCATCAKKSEYNQVDQYHYYHETGECALPRTRSNTLFAAIYLMTLGFNSNSFLGVTGLSVLILTNLFDYVRDCVIDPMHNLFLHVVPDLMDLWFDERWKVGIIFASQLANCYTG